MSRSCWPHFSRWRTRAATAHERDIVSEKADKELIDMESASVLYDGIATVPNVVCDEVEKGEGGSDREGPAG